MSNTFNWFTSPLEQFQDFNFGTKTNNGVINNNFLYKFGTIDGYLMHSVEFARNYIYNSSIVLNYEVILAGIILCIYLLSVVLSYFVSATNGKNKPILGLSNFYSNVICLILAYIASFILITVLLILVRFSNSVLSILFDDYLEATNVSIEKSYYFLSVLNFRYLPLSLLYYLTIIMLIGQLVTDVKPKVVSVYKSSKEITMYGVTQLYKLSVELLKSSVEDEERASRAYVPLIFTIFFTVLTANLLGMLPYSFAVTSQLIVTFYLAATIIAYIVYDILNRQGIKHLLSLFMPSGTPLLLGLLLVPIEIVSFSFKAVSLSVRLFANIMAGHTLLKVILNFTWVFLMASGWSYFFIFIPFIVLCLLTLLEIGVAFIQAYVFSILTCLYLRDAFSGH